MDSLMPILIVLAIGAMVLFHYIPVGLWMEAVSAGVPMNPLLLLVM